MKWTKENNPHSGKAKSAKKTASRKAGWAQIEHKGHKQFGDFALYGKNPKSHSTQYHVPEDAVGPGDIVDDVEPGKLYTFYLFNPSDTSDDAARELDRLRRGGYKKCEAPRFFSLTEKFETRDGVLVLGRRVWYFVDYARKVANREKARREDGPDAVAAAQDRLIAEMRAGGAGADAQQNAVLRGERTK